MSGTLSAVSIQAIQFELRRRERRLSSLQRRHAHLTARLDALARAIAAAGGAPVLTSSRMGAGAADGRSRRRVNKLSLVQALGAVLKGKTMSVKNAAEAVRRAGYRTASRHFYTQVNIALIKSGKFRRVSRGKYQAKSNG